MVLISGVTGAVGVVLHFVKGIPLSMGLICLGVSWLLGMIEAVREAITEIKLSRKMMREALVHNDTSELEQYKQWEKKAFKDLFLFSPVATPAWFLLCIVAFVLMFGGSLVFELMDVFDGRRCRC